MTATKVDLGAPLPLSHIRAIQQAARLRRSHHTMSWPAIAFIMRDYHGVKRVPGWWAEKVKELDPTLARPRGIPTKGHVHRAPIPKRLSLRVFSILEGPPEPACGARRGATKHSLVVCEAPPGHDGDHIGRSPMGFWFSWS